MRTIMSSLLFIAMLLCQEAYSYSSLLNRTLPNDGPCINLSRIKLEDLDLDLAFQFMSKPGYVPMASKLNYITVARLLKPEADMTLQQLQKNLCLKYFIGMFDNVLTGFRGAQVELSCDINDIAAVSCFEKKYPMRGNIDMNWVWSDNKETMLTISCLPNGLAAWNILSFVPTMNETTKALVFKQLEKYGFNQHNAMTLSYHNC